MKFLLVISTVDSKAMFIKRLFFAQYFIANESITVLTNIYFRMAQFISIKLDQFCLAVILRGVSWFRWYFQRKPESIISLVTCLHRKRK